ncbi:hypothetical protein MTO96_022569 [Rhipicephalus appendiculatus]
MPDMSVMLPTKMPSEKWNSSLGVGMDGFSLNSTSSRTQKKEALEASRDASQENVEVPRCSSWRSPTVSMGRKGRLFPVASDNADVISAVMLRRRERAMRDALEVREVESVGGLDVFDVDSESTRCEACDMSSMWRPRLLGGTQRPRAEWMGRRF